MANIIRHFLFPLRPQKFFEIHRMKKNLFNIAGKGKRLPAQGGSQFAACSYDTVGALRKKPECIERFFAKLHLIKNDEIFFGINRAAQVLTKGFYDSRHTCWAGEYFFDTNKVSLKIEVDNIFLAKASLAKVLSTIGFPHAARASEKQRRTPIRTFVAIGPRIKLLFDFSFHGQSACPLLAYLLIF
ncbi:MAG: hypothetical protein RR204_00925 [Raoultibacter sp.]